MIPFVVICVVGGIFFLLRKVLPSSKKVMVEPNQSSQQTTSADAQASAETTKKWYTPKDGWWKLIVDMWKGRIFPVVIGMIVLYFIVAFKWYAWWKANLFSWNFLVPIIVTIFFASMTKPAKEPFKYKFGWWGLIFMLLVAFGPIIKKSIPREGTPPVQTFVPTPNSLRLPPAHRIEDEEPEAAALARSELKDQPDLLERITEESGLRHHKMVDGKFDPTQILHGTNPDGSEGPAIGVAQINVRVNGKFCSDHGRDVTLIIGNLRCAKLLYAEYGLAPWYTDPRSPEFLEFPLEVQSQTFGVVFRKPPVKSFEFHFDHNVEVRVNGKDLYVDGPASNPTLPYPVNTMEFRLLEGDEKTVAKATVKYYLRKS